MCLASLPRYHSVSTTFDNSVDVFWLEQATCDLPSGNDWLSPAELEKLESMRFPRRRSDWRLGRWTAKRAISGCLNLGRDSQSLASIEIRPAPSGAPEVFIFDRPSTATISISHREGRAFCAATLERIALGCDLELIEPRTETFISDYFTGDEQAWISETPEADRSALLALLWSAKESALKAATTGLRRDTRSVVIARFEKTNLSPVLPTSHPDEARIDDAFVPWQPLHVYSLDGEDYCGWWSRSGNWVRTIVSRPAASAPLVLNLIKE